MPGQVSRFNPSMICFASFLFGFSHSTFQDVVADEAHDLRQLFLSLAQA